MKYSTVWEDKNFMPDADERVAKINVRAGDSDKCMVELVLAGDETAFESIFERHKKFVAIVASRYFQRPEQIEEIVQISFAKAYFELKNFRSAYDYSLASWLGKITTNACLDTLRKQKRKPENLHCEFTEVEIEYLHADATQQKNNAEKTLVDRDLARKLLSHLPAEDRAILQMLDAEEMSVKEIAEITGWSKSKIKVRAFRARNAVRKILLKFL